MDQPRKIIRTFSRKNGFTSVKTTASTNISPQKKNWDFTFEAKRSNIGSLAFDSKPNDDNERDNKDNPFEFEENEPPAARSLPLRTSTSESSLLSKPTKDASLDSFVVTFTGSKKKRQALNFDKSPTKKTVPMKKYGKSEVDIQTTVSQNKKPTFFKSKSVTESSQSRKLAQKSCLPKDFDDFDNVDDDCDDSSEEKESEPSHSQQSKKRKLKIYESNKIDGLETTTSIRVKKSEKSLFTVVPHVSEPMILSEFGETSQAEEDVFFFTTCLLSTENVSTRNLCAPKFIKACIDKPSFLDAMVNADELKTLCSNCFSDLKQNSTISMTAVAFLFISSTSIKVKKSLPGPLASLLLEVLKNDCHSTSKVCTEIAEFITKLCSTLETSEKCLLTKNITSSTLSKQALVNLTSSSSSFKTRTSLIENGSLKYLLGLINEEFSFSPDNVTPEMEIFCSSLINLTDSLPDHLRLNGNASVAVCIELVTKYVSSKLCGKKPSTELICQSFLRLIHNLIFSEAEVVVFLANKGESLLVALFNQLLKFCDAMAKRSTDQSLLSRVPFILAGLSILFECSWHSPKQIFSDVLGLDTPRKLKEFVSAISGLLDRLETMETDFDSKAFGDAKQAQLDDGTDESAAIAALEADSSVLMQFSVLTSGLCLLLAAFCRDNEDTTTFIQKQISGLLPSKSFDQILEMLIKFRTFSAVVHKRQKNLIERQDKLFVFWKSLAASSHVSC